MRGISVYRRPQVIKLSTLLDFYETDPDSNYTILIQNGLIRTLVQSNHPTPHLSQDYNSSLQSEICADAKPLGKMGRKQVGLFSNVIKKMDTNRNQQPQDVKVNTKRSYQFYFPQFSHSSEENQCKPMEGTSTKRVKERATGNINLDLKRMNNGQSKENKNELNARQQGKPAHCDNDNEKQPFVEINFSFEEIQQQLETKKSTNSPKNTLTEHFQLKTAQTVEPPLLKKQSSGRGKQKITSKPNQNEQCQPEGQSKEISIPKSLIPNMDNFSIELDARKEVFSPIPHKSRHQIRLKEESRAELKVKPVLSVQGAKKAQSRVYNNNCDDSKDIKIDFDLDIDF